MSIGKLLYKLQLSKEENIIDFDSLPLEISHIWNIISFVLYILIPIFVSYIQTKSFDKMGHPASMKDQNVTEVTEAGDIIVPTFLAYIFVGLGISNVISLISVLLLLIIFGLKSQTYLYNPVLLLLGYHFYYVKEGKYKYLLMTRRKLNKGDSMDFDNLRQITDYTFIEV